jgi:hypothetical protein
LKAFSYIAALGIADCQCWHNACGTLERRGYVNCSERK